MFVREKAIKLPDQGEIPESKVDRSWPQEPQPAPHTAVQIRCAKQGLCCGFTVLWRNLVG